MVKNDNNESDDADGEGDDDVDVDDNAKKAKSFTSQVAHGAGAYLLVSVV